MPTASVSDPIHHLQINDLVARISSTDPNIKLKALRDIKNQIIGNRTKKLSFLRLNAIPAITAALSDPHVTNSILLESAAALGSFACGCDAGVKAIVDAGAVPPLTSLLSNADEKVVNASARSLRMIYQSKLAPKYGFLGDNNMKFVLTLLDNENENVSGLGASIIAHSCQTMVEQKALSEYGVLKKLILLLDGTLSQRDASLESLSTILKDNSQVISNFVGLEGGKFLTRVNELMKDRSPRTRLLSCMCLIAIRNASPCYLQEVGSKLKMVRLLLELLEDPGQVGDEAPFVFCSLIADKKDVQKLAYEANAVDKFADHLSKDLISPRRVQGILMALANLCATLESCRSKFLSLQVLNLVTDALAHDSADIRTAACTCIRSLTRSIKNLCAGHFMNQTIVIPLVRLLDDSLVSVQVAALGAISNILIDFTARKATFLESGGMRKLIELLESMDSTVRLHALWALRNMMFMADDGLKEMLFLELNAFLLASLVHDPEPSVQEQALALVRNLIDGSLDSLEYVFAEDAVILDAIVRLLQTSSKSEIGIQGMYVLCNVTSGTEYQKEAVVPRILLHGENENQSFMIKLLQNTDSRLRTAAVWVLVNLTSPSYPGAFRRLEKLWDAGVVSQVRRMANDPCLDVKVSALGIATPRLSLPGGNLTFGFVFYFGLSSFVQEQSLLMLTHALSFGDRFA